MSGKFITIEGQDGAGKSTNLKVIKDWLQARGVKLVQTREPGGTPFGEQVRKQLLNDGDELIGDTAELLMIFAARAQHLEQVIQPALARGDWVLCDRFTDATFAYQGGGRGLSMDTITALQTLVQGKLRPDLTLLLDLPTDLSESRAGQRSTPDRFEQQQRQFKQRVRDTYLARAQAEPSRIKVVDASQTFDDVRQSVINHLTRFVGSSE